MNIVQPGKVRVLVRESRFPEIMPNFAAWGVVEFVNPLRRFLMQPAKHLSEIVGAVIGRMANKVIVI